MAQGKEKRYVCIRRNWFMSHLWEVGDVVTFDDPDTKVPRHFELETGESVAELRKKNDAKPAKRVDDLAGSERIPIEARVGKGGVKVDGLPDGAAAPGATDSTKGLSGPASIDNQ